MPDPLHKLTAREREVLVFVHAGLCNKEIALRLRLRWRTIEWYCQRICEKLATRNRTTAAVLWERYGEPRRGPTRKVTGWNVPKSCAKGAL